MVGLLVFFLRLKEAQMGSSCKIQLLVSIVLSLPWYGPILSSFFFFFFLATTMALWTWIWVLCIWVIRVSKYVCFVRWKFLYSKSLSKFCPLDFCPFCIFHVFYWRPKSGLAMLIADLHWQELPFTLGLCFSIFPEADWKPDNDKLLLDSFQATDWWCSEKVQAHQVFSHI